MTPDGRVIGWCLSPGNEHDAVAVQRLWAFWDWSRVFAVIADRGYDTDNIRKLVALMMAVSVIPPKKNRKKNIEYDKMLYRARTKVECMFGRVKENGRCAIRKDKNDQNFASFFAIAIIKLETKSFVNSA